MTFSDPWIHDLTIAEVLDQTADRFGQREALVFPQHSIRLTFDDLRREARATGRALMALGAQPGDHIGIWATNWPEWVILQLATAHIGAVLVNVNPAYRASELRYVLNQADIGMLFLTDRVKTSDCFDILEEVCPELREGELQSSACPKLRRVISIKREPRRGYLTWDQFLQDASQTSEEALNQRQAMVRPDDVVNIQYTSGTTGFPKGAMLTHRNLLLNAYYVGDRQKISEADRLCLPVPFYHCFGCVMGVLVCVIYGSAMVIPAEIFDPLATLQAIQDEQCTSLYGVPTMFIAQLDHPRFAEFDLSSLRTGVMAGSPCPVDVMKAVEEKMGAREMTIAYGLTEASPVITQTTTTDDREHRVGTVGTILPGLEVRLVKPDTLEDVRIGETGELIVRGHGVMKGYYNKPKETEEAITPEGWLHSGDLAIQGEDHYYRINGRIKDMIIRGGENIYPREIEEYLRGHPEIADAQVVGLPDAKFGEVVSAWIRLHPGATLTEEDIIAYCRGQIAHYKVPLHVVLLEEYPTTVTGKIQKFKLREMGIEHFHLHAD